MPDLVKTDRPVATTRQPTIAELEELAAKPLRMLPSEWRVATWKFWSCWSAILKDQLSLCSRLQEWIAGKGLTLAEAERAFWVVNQPERMAGIHYAGQLLGMLAGEIGVIIARRQAQEEAERRQQQAAQWDAERVEKAPGLGRLVAAWTPPQPR